MGDSGVLVGVGLGDCVGAGVFDNGVFKPTVPAKPGKGFEAGIDSCMRISLRSVGAFIFLL